jgi:S1-C subfamily serine protease
MTFIKRFGAAVTVTLLVGLAASGCGVFPNFPALPDITAAEIRSLDLVPVLEPESGTQGDIGSLGFSDIERMTVRIRNIRCTGLGTGTGFAIDPFTIVTNRHVLEGAETLVISTFDGRDINVALPDIIMSDDADIALIRVNDPLDAYVTSRRGQLFQDEPVTVVGFPEGGQMTTTAGVVLGLIYDNANENMGSVILTDAQVLPGSSGSPLLDADANLIGVIYARTEEFLGLAVRIDLLDALLAGTAETSPLISCRA